MKKPIKTNETMLKALFNDLSGIETALLRERIVKIFEITKKSIEESPEEWAKNPIVHPNAYLRLGEKVTEYIGFNKD